MTVHSIPPVYNCESRILVLGSFPSVKSRESGFFYGHPQNRFWKVLSAVCNMPLPETNEEKRTFLLSAHIALWDVVASCEISGSADSSIRRVQPNDFSEILSAANIKAVFTNGKTADRLYDVHCKNNIPLQKLCLPSTSPANARYSLPRLIEEWQVVKAFLRDE